MSAVAARDNGSGGTVETERSMPVSVSFEISKADDRHASRGSVGVGRGEGRRRPYFPRLGHFTSMFYC